MFDTASRLLVVRRQRGREVERREFIFGPLTPDAMAHSVAELRVDVLLCAAISQPLRLVLERNGVRVESHLCGEVEALLAAFCAGKCRRAEFRMPGCWGEHGRSTPSRRTCPTRMAEAPQAGGVQ